MPSVALTKRQLEILDYYRAYAARHRISPTLEEVAQHFGVNKVTIFGHVAELERKGALARAAKGVSRGMLIVDQPGGVDTRTPSTVTIVGRIAAGSPIATIEAPEAFDLADLIPADRDIYALRVAGRSMIDDGIHDGDIVLVERRSNASDGDLVVAVLPEEEATLKRVYRERGGFRLEPANRELEAIHVAEIEVRGVVIGVVRRYGR